VGDVANGTTRLFRREASQPAFNATGSRLAFLSWAQTSRGLVTASSTGGNETQITNFEEDKLPTWSPDGSSIAFFTRRSGNRASELYRVSPDQDFRNNTPRYLNEGEYPTWGQSDKIVFKGWGKTGSGLHVGSPNLSNPDQVTSTNQDTAPALSPDGQEVAFMSQREGDWEIYVINVDGSNLRRLTNNPADDGLPTWSPDGKAIAFMSNRDGGWSIMVMAPNGREQQKLFTMSGSPNGTVFNDRNNSTGWLEERISWAP
jgi:TolB protein